MQAKPVCTEYYGSPYSHPLPTPHHPVASEPLLAHRTGLSPSYPALLVHADLCTHGAPYLVHPAPFSAFLPGSLLSFPHVPVHPG